MSSMTVTWSIFIFHKEGLVTKNRSLRNHRRRLWLMLRARGVIKIKPPRLTPARWSKRAVAA